MSRIHGAVRLSRMTDASTSPERQREQIEMWAKLHGHEVVSWSTDTDVSGKVSPFKRAGLGPYLKSPDFDILVTAKIDRASRSVRDLHDLVDYLQKHGKSYSSVAESFDMTTGAGKLIMTVLAAMAEFERDRMSERRAEAAAKLKDLGAWNGGVVPLGWKIQGRQIVPDPESDGYRTIRQAGGLLAAGYSLAEVARRLDAPTSRGNQWDYRAVKRVMETEHAQVILGDELTADVTAALARLATVWTRHDSAPLSRLLRCPGGHTVSSNREASRPGKVYEYYRCSAKVCPHRRNVRQQVVHEAVLEQFAAFDHLPYGTLKSSADNRKDVLAALARQLRALDPLSATYDTDHARIRAELQRAQDAPPEPASAMWQPDPKGRTIGDVRGQTIEAAAAVMRKYELTATVSRDGYVTMTEGTLDDMIRELGGQPLAEQYREIIEATRPFTEAMERRRRGEAN